MKDEQDLLPLLTVVSGPLQGVSFRLRPGVRVLGREEGVDILIEDRRVSRRHATLELSDGRAFLADNDSTNGTWVNEQRVASVAELCDGDRIRLGHVELRYFDPSSATTVRVSTGQYPMAPVSSTPRAGASEALTGPTQLVAATRRPARLLLMLGGAALAGWIAWLFLTL